MKKLPGRRTFLLVVITGVGIVLVSVLAMLPNIIIDCHVKSLRRNASCFEAFLLAPHETWRGRACEKFLCTNVGKERLFRVFVSEVIDTWARFDLNLLQVGYNQEYPLEDLDAALLWIGPKMSGLKPAGESLATHVIARSKESSHIWHSAIVSADDHVAYCKAIMGRLESLVGTEFVFDKAPSFRFNFMLGKEAISLFGKGMWMETAFADEQIICLAARSGGLSAPSARP